MCKLNTLAQELIIRTYRAPPGGADKPQAHLQTVIKGVRAAMERGMTNVERNRLCALACTGHKLSYTACKWHGKRTCAKGAQCHHIHGV